ncbi:Auxin efflux carrier family protein [Quillaja saponaria]|uniref:Auxin efflux carrier family protein n=1 Tax=Quillaja saponaria TaxID=32244 RepID=A0AAD7PF34_QUISA|nr:Auxin efflux carrier family protein [Quillaja saponaria]
MTMLWFMPFNVLISFIIGSILGWILLKIIKVPDILRGLVLGCCAAGNLGNILLIIIPAVCKERGSPFGDTDICNAHGLAYASLSMAIGTIYLWLYVYNMVRIAASQRSSASNLEEPKSPEKNSNLSGTTAVPMLPSSELCSKSQDHMDKLELGHQPEPNSKALITVADEKPKKLQTRVKKIVLQVKDIASKYLNLKTLFAPSTVGAILGMIVGVVAPIRKLMIGDTAPLRVIQDSTALLGDAAVPTITLIVGANLPKGLRKSDLKISVIISIIVVRFIILPFTGILVVKAAIHLGLVSGSDPLYQFILLLQFTTPPAINISTITQLFGVGESECSVIFLATYALAPVALTLWSTLYLWLVHN